MDKATGKAIVQEVIDLVLTALPGAVMRPMYGGTVFELQDNVAASRIGGVYAYDAHVSVEFANGATFADPTGHLEGGGKQRRHLKLRTIEEIETKTVQHFLDQAVATYTTATT